MGQKVHPTGIRLGIVKKHTSTWFAEGQEYADNLLVDLQKEFNLAYLFIAHDLAVVKHISDRISIMYLGKIVEESTSESIYQQPRHPYTRSLISAIPVPNPHKHVQREVLVGDVPSPINPPSGCRFHPRCPQVMDKCKFEAPSLRPVADHQVSCHLDFKE